MKFKTGHPLLRKLYEEGIKMGNTVSPGGSGPNLLTKEVEGFQDVTILNTKTFYPLHYSQATWMIDSGKCRLCLDAITENVYAVHWWNEMLRIAGVPKDVLPPKESFLGQSFDQILFSN